MLDKAWSATNTNQFGTNEFVAWCEAVGADPLMGLNLGTGTAERPRAGGILQCGEGVRWSDLHGEHGFAEPYKVKPLVPGERNGRSLADRSA